MKFEGNLRVWVETEHLEEAEQLLCAASAAAYESLGSAAIRDPELNGLYGGSMHGLDDEAVAALTEDDMGPGRDWMTFTYGDDQDRGSG
jgi:hypothetical protein